MDYVNDEVCATSRAYISYMRQKNITVQRDYLRGKGVGAECYSNIVRKANKGGLPKGHAKSGTGSSTVLCLFHEK